MTGYKKTIHSEWISDTERKDVDNFFANLHENIKTPPPVQPGVTSRGNIFQNESGNIIFKIYRLSEKKTIEKIRSKFKLKDRKFKERFGWSEWINSLAAAQLKISIPTPLAYFETGNIFGCEMQIVASQRLQDFNTILDLLIAGHDPLNAIECAIDPIEQLVSRNAFHADLNCRNIMVSSDMKTKKIIDWEYACFDQRPNASLLPYYLGYLYFGGAKRFIDEGSYDRWTTERIIKAQNNSSTIDEAMRFYTLAKKNHFSRVERYSMFSR